MAHVTFQLVCPLFVCVYTRVPNQIISPSFVKVTHSKHTSSSCLLILPLPPSLSNSKPTDGLAIAVTDPNQTQRRRTSLHRAKPPAPCLPLTHPPFPSFPPSPKTEGLAIAVTDPIRHNQGVQSVKAQTSSPFPAPHSPTHPHKQTAWPSPFRTPSNTTKACKPTSGTASPPTPTTPAKSSKPPAPPFCVVTPTFTSSTPS